MEVKPALSGSYFLIGQELNVTTPPSTTARTLAPNDIINMSGVVTQPKLLTGALGTTAVFFLCLLQTGLETESVSSPSLTRFHQRKHSASRLMNYICQHLGNARLQLEGCETLNNTWQRNMTGQS